jgi:hypothetical protein
LEDDLMASDIPSVGFPGSVAMTRALVTYIDCPRRVRAAVLDNFDSAPTLDAIRRMRAEHLAPRKADRCEPVRLTDAYYPADASKSLHETNRKFLWRLDQERIKSARQLERGGVVA